MRRTGLARGCVTGLLLLAGLQAGCAGQVFRVATGVGNLNSGEGANLSVLENDSETSVGVGVLGGVRLSARREVAAEGRTLAVGDSTLSLRLPTDLDRAGRTVQGRGLLLQQGGSAEASVFVGSTGESHANPYVNALTPSRFLSVVAAKAPLAGGALTLLHTAGARNNALMGWSTATQRHALAATVGRSEGHAVFQMLGHLGDGRTHLEGLLSLGKLQLRPAVAGQAAQPERTGLNVIASRRFGQGLVVDVARHSYDTTDVASDPLFAGVTAPRSLLLESGASFAVHALRLQARALSSSSGAQRTVGTVASALWLERCWSVQATLLRSQNSTAGGVPHMTAQSSVQLQSKQQVLPRLRLEQNLDVNGSQRNVSVGGAWDDGRVALSMTERQTFVPFGAVRGFHPVMVFGVHMRFGGGAADVAVSRGGDLPTAVLVSTTGYYGSLQGQERSTAFASLRLPRYAVTGRVVDTVGKAVHGAAVRVASQIVFTDANGRFQLRLDRNRPVPVQTLPEAFLTERQYRSVSGAQLVQPVPFASASEPATVLQVEPCAACGTEVGVASPADTAPVPASFRRSLGQAGRSLWRLVGRLCWGKPHAT